MDKFKVGDKVRIINCVEPYSEEFNDYIGKTAIITKVNNFSTYDIDIDKGENNWYNSELELADKPKEYTIHNLINDFPEGIKFVNSGGRKCKIQRGELYYYDFSEQIWDRSIATLKQILDMKFIKVEEPIPKLKAMTFNEAVKTGKKIGYKYYHINTEGDKPFIIIFEQTNFFMPEYAIKNTTECNPTYVVDIITKGTWYAEGVYE